MSKKYPKKIDFNIEDFNLLKLSELKRMTDYWLRQYLLSKAERRGKKIFCPIKQRWYPENKIHVAHYIDRHIMNTRYDLENCHLISEQSNVWDAKVPKEGYKSLHHYDYEMYLGEKKVKNLLEKSKEINIFGRQEYVNLILKFKNV